MNELTLVSIGLFHLKALALALPLLAILYGIKRLSAQERYLALRIAFGVLAAIPLLAWLAPEFRVSVTEWPATLPTSISVTASILSADSPQIAPTSVEFSIESALAVSYGLVTALLLLRLITQFYVTQREISRYPSTSDSELGRLFDELRHTLKIESTIELRIGDDDTDVYVWGITKQVIVLPKRFAGLSMQVRRTVLIHELIHVRRRDTVICLFVQALCCFYWLNPIIWLLNKRLKLEMERSCDDAALSSGIAATDYADRLLKMATLSVASRSPPNYVVTMARATTLHRRIDSLLNDKLRRGVMNKPKLISLTIVLAGVGLFIGACTVSRPGIPATAPPQKSQSVDVRVAVPVTLANPGKEIDQWAQKLEKIFSEQGFALRTFDVDRIESGNSKIKISGESDSNQHIVELLRALNSIGVDPSLEYVKQMPNGQAKEFALHIRPPSATP